MAFALPSVKVKPSLTGNFNVHEGPFGVPDLMTNGLASAKNVIDIPHLLMNSETNYVKNRERMNLTILRNTQGLHAPLKLTMEMKAANKIGRLPFLSSSNIMRDVLSGCDIEMGFEDILTTSEFREISGQPHAMVERALGIL